MIDFSSFHSRQNISNNVMEIDTSRFMLMNDKDQPSRISTIIQTDFNFEDRTHHTRQKSIKINTRYDEGKDINPLKGN